MSNKQFPQDFQKVQKNKQLWKSIEFKLQLSLGISSVIINNIWNIENTHLIAQFSSESKGGIVLQSFIPKQKLTEKNRLTKICEKGYDIADEGMIVNVGFNIEKSLKQKKQSSCIMNKISVGKSYCYDMNKYQQSAISCPEGFQSIYLYNDEEEQTVKYNHQYILFRSTQIIPCYYIEYNIIGSKQQQKIPSCENCNRPEPAKFYCVTEEAYFCIDCDKQYHDSKIAAKHNRVDVGDKPKKFGVCSLHSGRVLELYCAICCQALCFDCKVFGDHNQKNMSDHKLSRLDKAYSEIASKVKEIDPNIERRKNQLTQDLSKIDLKIKEINQKATHIEEQLQAIYCKVLSELKSQTQTKLSYLIGDQLQLKRQYDHIQWIQGFIKFASQTQQSQQFLKSWNRYSKYKKQILGLQNLSINTQVKADMKLVGHLSIEVESKKKHPIHDMSSYQKIPENIMTPVKQYDNIDKQLGSTSLRKTIFKKHYVDKSKQMGSEPKMAKGGTTMNKVPLESDV